MDRSFMPVFSFAFLKRKNGIFLVVMRARKVAHECLFMLHGLFFPRAVLIRSHDIIVNLKEKTGMVSFL